MAILEYDSKTRTLQAVLWDGTSLADITTLAGEGAVITIPAIQITIGGDTVTVANGAYFCVDSDDVPAAQTGAEIAAAWDESA
jgi:hypothetical protein